MTDTRLIIYSIIFSISLVLFIIFLWLYTRKPENRNIWYLIFGIIFGIAFVVFLILLFVELDKMEKMEELTITNENLPSYPEQVKFVPKFTKLDPVVIDIKETNIVKS
jgi:RsiW-degrading membrane proteinase PrsW (M82 family)